MDIDYIVRLDGKVTVSWQILIKLSLQAFDWLSIIYSHTTYQAYDWLLALGLCTDLKKRRKKFQDTFSYFTSSLARSLDKDGKLQGERHLALEMVALSTRQTVTA